VAAIAAVDVWPRGGRRRGGRPEHRRAQSSSFKYAAPSGERDIVATSLVVVLRWL